MPELRFILGPPASGKTTYAEQFVERGHVRLNRDTQGGKIIDLLPKMVATLKQGRSVVMDNLFAAAKTRQPFLEQAAAVGVEVHAHIMGASIEDAQINALHRMWSRYGRIFMTAEEKASHDKAKKDSNIFPIAVLFQYRKKYEAPSKNEGFSSIKKEKFVRRHPGPEYINKAIIFDYDDTLRHSTGPLNWPEQPSEVELLPGRKIVVQHLRNEDAILAAVSNQSAISKGLSVEAAVACFERTNELLDVDLEYYFCPHKAPPITCYCRKPQCGFGVLLIEKYKLTPAECIFVGDQTTDKTFAGRLGFHYAEANDFF